MNKNLIFEKVIGNDRQKEILFNLLKKRKYNISHSELPDRKKHNSFVCNHPYREWYIVIRKKEVLGTFYIKFDNSIGLNLIDQNIENIEMILNFIKQNFSINKEVSSMIPSFFYINISSDNLELQAILDKIDVRKLQISYKI